MTIAEVEELAPVSDDISELHAWALIVVGSAMTTVGAVWPQPGSPLAWMAAAWFFLFQVGVSLSARRARNSWLRREWFTLGVSAVCMIVFGLLAHEGFVQAFTVMQNAGLATGMSADLMWWVLFAMPFLEPAGFWINAVHKEWRKVRVGESAKPVDSFSAPAAPEQPPTRKTHQRATSREKGWIPQVVKGSAIAMLMSQVGIAPRDAAAFERVWALRNEHPTADKTWIASQAGAPRSTVGRWLSKMDAVDVVPVAAA